MGTRWIIFLMLMAFNFGTARTMAKISGTDNSEIAMLMEASEKKADKLAVRSLAPQMIIAEIIKAAIKKVLRAMDLVFQRLQAVQLKVQTTLEQAKNIMAESKLGEVNELVKEKKEIFDKYYEELWTIRNKMDQIKAIKAAILSQGKMIENFTLVFGKFSGDSYLNEGELSQIFDIYNGMMQKNVGSIEDLWLLIKDFSVKMQDGDRLGLIKEKVDAISDVSADFNGFTQGVINMSLSRAKEGKELKEIKMYYGLED